jgi:hypothetical protein
MAGVLELDTQGTVVASCVKGQPVFNAHTLLGLPESMVVGAWNRRTYSLGLGAHESLSRLLGAQTYPRPQSCSVAAMFSSYHALPSCKQCFAR